MHVRLAAALFGAAFGFLGYAATGGRRDFTSNSQIVAGSYAVLCQSQQAEKARDLMIPVVGAANAARLIETVLALETVKDIRTLRPLLQRA